MRFVGAAVLAAGVLGSNLWAAMAVAPKPKKGACCFANGTCQILTVTQCFQAGGSYLGNNTSCADCPPPPPPNGACCIDGDCDQMSEADCAAAGGTYNGDNSICTVFPPPCAPDGPDGACCIPGLGGTFCAETNEFLCLLQGGEWQGAFTSCDDIDCPQPPPPPGEEEQ